MNKMRLKNMLIGLFAILLINIQVAYGAITPVTNTISKEMLAKGTYQKSCPIAPERLSIVTFKYVDFSGKVHNDGKIMVMDAVAKNVENIFNELFALKFPIAKSKLIEAYNGNDKLSLADNNTTSFNCRTKIGDEASQLLSIHSYGLAIDINPIQNPFVNYDETQKNHAIVLPVKGIEYLNRINLRAGMAEQVVNIFKKNGFTIWGGTWNDPIDWQHFQTSSSVAQILAVMTKSDAKAFFNLYVKNPKLFNTVNYRDDRFIKLYQNDPKIFMQVMEEKFYEISDLSAEEALNSIEKEMNL